MHRGYLHFLSHPRDTNTTFGHFVVLLRVRGANVAVSAMGEIITDCPLPFAVNLLGFVGLLRFREYGKLLLRDWAVPPKYSPGKEAIQKLSVAGEGFLATPFFVCPPQLGGRFYAILSSGSVR